MLGQQRKFCHVKATPCVCVCGRYLHDIVMEGRRLNISALPGELSLEEARAHTMSGIQDCLEERSHSGLIDFESPGC